MKIKAGVSVFCFAICISLCGQDFDGFDENDSFIKKDKKKFVPHRQPATAKASVLRVAKDSAMGKLAEYTRAEAAANKRVKLKIYSGKLDKVNPMEAYERYQAEMAKIKKGYNTKQSYTVLPVLPKSNVTLKEVVKARELKIEIDYEPKFNYFLSHLGEPLIKKIKITNTSKKVAQNIIVNAKISPDTYSSEWNQNIAFINPGQTVELKDIVIPIKHKAFKEVKERLSAALMVTIKDSKNILHVSTSKFEILAYNEWFMDLKNAEYLCAFVRPNAAAVKKILSMSRKRLKALSGSDSFEDYQARNPKRVIAMLTAIHQTMNKDLDIGYITIPSSFERGQKIRSHSDVLKYSQGTCLDLAVLEAAAWESAGLHPVIIIIPGHAFVACWLSRKQYGKAINIAKNNSSAKRILQPIESRELLLMNSTTLTHDGKKGTFEAAVREGNALVKNCLKNGKWMIFIDVKSSRRNKEGKSVRPLPF